MQKRLVEMNKEPSKVVVTFHVLSKEIILVAKHTQVVLFFASQEGVQAYLQGVFGFNKQLNALIQIA